VETDESILTAAAAAGIYIHAACGGEGVCGKCRIQLERGDVRNTHGTGLTEKEYGEGIRLACTSRVVSDLVVRIPDTVGADGRSLACRPKTTRPLSARSLETLVGTWETAPPVRKIALQLPPPTLDDNISDMQRLLRGIRQTLPDSPEPYYDHTELLKELPFMLREANWHVTVILLHGKHAEDPETIMPSRRATPPTGCTGWPATSAPPPSAGSSSTSTPAQRSPSPRATTPRCPAAPTLSHASSIR